MTLVYLVGGSAMGLWQTFSSSGPLLDLAAIKMFAGPVVFVAVGLAESAVDWLRGKAPCGASEKM
jgi:hypothetical protein